MNELDLYTDLIMESANSNLHKHTIENATASEHGHNPSCGDDITIQIKCDNGVIEDIAFTGVGCAISQSSTSIMIDVLIGKTLIQAKEVVKNFINLIKREKLTKKQVASLGNAIAFENISNMPARVKCATMPWHTMESLLTKINELLTK